MPQASINGISLHYQVEGEGEPLLLVMGLGGTLEGWRKQIPLLTKHFQVIRFDNRGSGQSDAPLDISEYSMAQFAADAIGLLDQLNIQQAHVWGVSMGGMIAQHIALNNPERVKKLVLGCTLPHYGADDYFIAHLPPAFHERLLEFAPEPWVLETLLGSVAKSPEETMHDSIKFNFSPDFPAKHPDIIEEYVATGMEQISPVHGFMGQWSAILQHTTLSDISKLPMPVLVQHGDQDQLVPIVNGELIAALVPHAQFQQFSGAGHVYFIEQPLDVTNGVIEFLRT